MKIIKVLEYHSRISKNHENHRIPFNNHENHENFRNTYENHENHENLGISMR